MTEDDITRLLMAWSDGDLQALDDLFPLAFQDLRRVARRCSLQVPSQDLQPTELIGSIYFTLRRQKRTHWECRAQFYRFAALLMERVLIDHRRELHAQKRGGQSVRVPLLEASDFPTHDDGSSLAPHLASEVSSRNTTPFENDVSQAIDIAEKIAELEKLDPLQAEVARLRYLIGLTVPQTAKTLKISEVKVKGMWRHAKRYLGIELRAYSPAERRDRGKRYDGDAT